MTSVLVLTMLTSVLASLPPAHAAGHEKILALGDIPWQGGKAVLGCTASAVPVILVGAVESVPILSALAAVAAQDKIPEDFDARMPDIDKGWGVIDAGAVLTLGYDLASGLTDLIIAPFDYAAHGKLELSYQPFSELRYSFISARILAVHMYGPSSVCARALKRIRRDARTVAAREKIEAEPASKTAAAAAIPDWAVRHHSRSENADAKAL